MNCYFKMCVKGEYEHIYRLYDALCMRRSLWIGKGVSINTHLGGLQANINFQDDENTAWIEGWCDESLKKAFFVSEVPERLKRKNLKPIESITLAEASKKWELVIEVFSDNQGRRKQEHIIIEAGTVKEDMATDTEVYFLYDRYEDKYLYKNRKTASKVIGTQITEEEWDIGYACRNPLGEWTFRI